MERKPLEFIHSWTVEQFKKLKDIDALSIRPGKEGKIFFTYGPNREDTGAVSAKLVENGYQRAIVSLVKGDNGEFYMLHQQGEGAPEIMSL